MAHLKFEWTTLGICMRTLPLPPTDPLAAHLYDVCLVMRERSQRNHAYCRFGLDDLAALSALRPILSGLDGYCQVIEQGLAAEITAPQNNERVLAIQNAYDAAIDLALPTCKEFLRWCHSTHGLTYTHSLRSIQLETLRDLEVRSHSDTALGKMIRNFKRRLRQISGVEDNKGFGQAFELFSEAVVYAYLKERLTSVEKIDEQGGKAGSTPDFKCLYDNLVFYVEVKSFDIVDGVHRAKQMMHDGVDVNIELEAQVNSGCSVAIAEQEIAPYKKAEKGATYDPRSSLLVIETIKAKARSAFKTSQFKAGPTLALASMGRLILPGDSQSVLPYYVKDDADGSHVLSGTLWQCCFGKRGATVLRYPEFATGSFDGYLETDGLYCAEHDVLPGIGLIVMKDASLDSECYGICNNASSLEQYGWDLDDTKRILSVLCTSYNDRENREANISVRVQQ